MASSELSVMLTAKGNLETELRGARDRVKDLSAEIRKIQSSGGTVGDELADEFRQATVAADKLGKKLNEVNRKVKETATTSTSAAAKVGKAWTKAASVFNNDLVAGLGAASLVLFGKNAVNTFAQVQDASSALSATFGANGDALIKWAKASGDALNLSQQEALSAAQTFAIFGQSAGLTGAQLETFTTDLVARAADLSSYFGGTTQAAIEALSSGLAGQSEVLRKYGIFADEATLKAEALALGIYDGIGPLSAQEKLLATQAAILKQSARAQGDVARTADSMANQIKDSQQQMADFQSTAGETIAVVLNPLLKLVNGLAKGFSTLPDPVKQIAIGIGLVGTAALIATPRIIAMRDALRGTSGAGLAVGKGGLKAAAGIGAITVALSALRSQADANGNVFTTEDAFATRSYGEALREIVQPGWFGSLQNGIAGLTDALVPHNTYLDDAKNKMAGFDTELVKLVGQGKTADAQRMFDELVAGGKEWGVTVDDVKGILPGYAAAMDAAADATGGIVDPLEDAGDAADDAKSKILPLTRAMNRFGRALNIRNALSTWRKSLKEFVEKPGKQTAISAAEAFQSTVSSYKEGSKAQARFVVDNYAEMKRTIKNSGLSQTAQEQLLGPLNDAKAAADQVLAKLNELDGMTISVSIKNKLQSMGDPGFATGGLVTGPGSGTSDSIPALLSNGEYVLRASAVRAIGLGTLNKLNYADKMTDPALLDRMAVGGTPTTVQSGPIIGSIVVNNPSRDVDVEKAVLRGMARAERIKKERG